MTPSFTQVRGSLVHFHLLQDDAGLYLVDTGLLGAIGRLEKAVARLGMSIADIRAIALTHGHLDHTRNVAEIRRRSGCRVFAPLADRDHVAGRHPYRGASRLCGWMEKIGRRVLAYEIPEIDHWFEPGEKLDLWGGLEAIALPGHTLGHCGLLSPSQRVLFAGDLFSNHFGWASLPPRWLNVDHAAARASLSLAAACDVDAIALSHCRKADGSAHLADLRKLVADG